MSSLATSFARPAVQARAAPRCVRCQVAQDKASSSTPSSEQDIPKPEWLPEQGQQVLDFLNAKDFDITKWEPYKQNVEKYVVNEPYNLCYGWKELPEIINGRAAMLGFVTAASAEILGAGPVLKQLAAGPQPVLLVLGLLTAASIIPVIKGVKGEYLSSLRETYTVPEGIFTEGLERVHARLAMAGMFTLLVIEMVKGSALL